MTTPNFTAETALYRTSRSYRTIRHTSGLATHVAAADRGEGGLFGGIASSTLYPAQIDRKVTADGSPDAGFAGGTCTSACCGLCTCCANSGGAACCNFCATKCG